MNDKPEFITPRFKNVQCFEALLKRADVEKYAQEHNIAFDEAVEILGREYLNKYATYSSVWIEGVSTRLERID